MYCGCVRENLSSWKIYTEGLGVKGHDMCNILNDQEASCVCIQMSFAPRESPNTARLSLLPSRMGKCYLICFNLHFLNSQQSAAGQLTLISSLCFIGSALNM